MVGNDRLYRSCAANHLWPAVLYRTFSLHFDGGPNAHDLGTYHCRPDLVAASIGTLAADTQPRLRRYGNYTRSVLENFVPRCDN